MDMLPARVICSDNLDWWSKIPTFVNDENLSTDITRASELESVQQSRYERQLERASVQ
jgi:hypothetical protein